MTLNLDSLKVLDAIVRQGSFAAAAKALDRAPSAISYSIQKLEEDTGTLLFDRSGRKATLTAAGELMLEQGRLLLDSADTLVARARALETGWETEITLVLDAVYDPECLWPMVERFDQEAPGTTLRIISEALNGTFEALITGRAALAVFGMQQQRPTGIKTRQVRKVRFIYVASPNHPATRQRKLDADVLGRFRAIAVADTARLNATRTVRLMPLQTVLTVSSFAAKASALIAGLGIGTLPEHIAAPLIAHGDLVPLDVIDTPDETPIHLAWRTDRTGKALRWLVRHLPDYLPEDHRDSCAQQP